jgi:hypothetical protein
VSPNVFSPTPSPVGPPSILRGFYTRRVEVVGNECLPAARDGEDHRATAARMREGKLACRLPSFLKRPGLDLHEALALAEEQTGDEAGRLAHIA